MRQRPARFRRPRQFFGGQGDEVDYRWPDPLFFGRRRGEDEGVRFDRWDLTYQLRVHESQGLRRHTLRRTGSRKRFFCCFSGSP